MSGPEGWNGKSVRKHVEDIATIAGCAERKASDALELAENARDEIASLQARLDEIEVRNG